VQVPFYNSITGKFLVHQDQGLNSNFTAGQMRTFKATRGLHDVDETMAAPEPYYKQILFLAKGIVR